MKIKFVSARELKTRYSVLGHFYECELKSELRVSCRSALEILTKEREIGFSDMQRGLPDAIFIMMNPGSSRPLKDLPPGTERLYRVTHKKTFVPTRPDTTQYQLMRVMCRMRWSHVRVLNLSDLREAKSKVFEALFKSLERDQGFRSHSVFTPSRRNELSAELLRKADAPLVCAWGVSSKLDSLTTVATEVLSAVGGCRGISKAGAAGKFFHPLPIRQADKEAWVAAMCKELGVDAESGKGRFLSGPPHTT